MRNKILYVLLVLVVFFVGAASNFFLFEYYIQPDIEGTSTIINEIRLEETAIEEAIEKGYDAVVVVESIKGNLVIASGTGFVYKTDDKHGFIMTNNHVIADGPEVAVIFSNGDRVEATILGGDTYADIAVLSVPVAHVTKVAELGTASDLRLGNTVFAIGAPISAEYSGTVTRGIISGQDRLVTVSIAGASSNDWIMRVIQTDAAINPGNSGGPLLNVLGKVIGVNSLKLVSNKIEGIGFAIPIDDAMQYVDSLEKGENVPRPVLGVQLLDVTETNALFYNNITVDKDIKSGAVIQLVLKDSPADKAGLKKGDIIQEIGERNIRNKAELRYELYKYNINSKVSVTYYRGTEKKEADITLTGLEE